MRLWIIGNGFDLHHGLHTRYLDYKAYLCQQNNTCASKYCQIQPNKLPQEVCRNCCKGKDGNSSCPVRRFNALPREDMKEDLWCDLEEACSFDIDGLLKRLDGWHGNRSGELDESAAEGLLYDDLRFAKDFTKSWFPKWVRKVEKELSKKGEKDQSVDVDELDDAFLTFNYTTTLQKIYGIPKERILYVHGCITQADEYPLVFGSPDITNEAIAAAIKRYAQSRELKVEQEGRLHSRLSELTAALKKEIQSRLIEARRFVYRRCNDLSTVKEVVVAGHSLGRIDRPYFDFLTEYFRSVKWRFLFHGERDLKNALEFCRKHRIDGYYMPWTSSWKLCGGCGPCGDKCPGFSNCKH